MSRKVIIILLFCAVLLQCLGCDSTQKNESSPVTVHLPYKPETAVGLSDEAAAYMEALWKNAKWETGITKTAYQYVFLYDTTTIRYTSNIGLFNDVGNNRHCYISDDKREYINLLISAILD